jgi:hypothetical protein
MKKLKRIIIKLILLTFGFLGAGGVGSVTFFGVQIFGTGLFLLIFGVVFLTLLFSDAFMVFLF